MRQSFGFSTLLGAAGLLTQYPASAASAKNSVHMEMVPLSVNEAALEDKYTDTLVSQEFIRSQAVQSNGHNDTFLN